MRFDDTTDTQPTRRKNRARPFRLLPIVVGMAGISLLQPTPALNSVAKPSEARVGPPTANVATVFAAVSQCRKGMTESERWRIAGAIHQESTKYGYDPLFIAAMVEVESQCKPTARGPKGAVGLIQIRPATARAVAKESGIPWKGDASLHDAATNLRLGVRYLWSLERRFDDPHLAIAAYNLGPTRVAGMARHRARGARYVKRVLARYRALVERYEEGLGGLGA
jgi:soluble lytic murein transglycosylase